jgi:hypothetical protein
MEKRRAETDSMVADVLADAKALRIKADETLAGKHDPVEYEERRVYVASKLTPVMALFAEASEYKQQSIREHLAHMMTYRAKAGEDFAKYMGTLADKVHGTELAVVVKPVPAERIQAGDKRINAKGTILTAVRQDGQRLYYKFTRESGAVLTAYTSPRAWRLMQTA